jgi:hypothetical protein
MPSLQGPSQDLANPRAYPFGIGSATPELARNRIRSLERNSVDFLSQAIGMGADGGRSCNSIVVPNALDLGSTELGSLEQRNKFC